MDWHYPTTWSVESTDGEFYIEKEGNLWHMWWRGKSLGKLVTLDAAKRCAEEVVRVHPPGGW